MRCPGTGQMPETMWSGNGRLLSYIRDSTLIQPYFQELAQNSENSGLKFTFGVFGLAPASLTDQDNHLVSAASKKAITQKRLLKTLPSGNNWIASHFICSACENWPSPWDYRLSSTQNTVSYFWPVTRRMADADLIKFKFEKNKKQEAP